MDIPARDLRKFAVGFRYGDNYWLSTGVTWPFGELLLEDNTLVLSSKVLKKEIGFSRSEIHAIRSVRRFFLFPEFEIVHSRPDVPRFICFASLERTSELRSSLRPFNLS